MIDTIQPQRKPRRLSQKERDDIYEKIIKKHGDVMKEEITAAMNLIVITSNSREEYVTRRDNYFSSWR